MLQKLFVLIALSFFIRFSAAQDSAEAEIPKPKIHWLGFNDDPHSPTKASVFSAVVPGLGQIYNRKYWKAPLVWAAMGAATYYIYNQRATMRRMNANFRLRFSDSLLDDPGPEEIQTRDSYRKGRDIGILALTGLYIIQIVDATVDAHFYKFNIDQDLSAWISPAPSRFLTFSYRF